MNFFSYLRVEINRIFHSKTTQIIMILSIMAPLLGYKLNGNIVYKINPNMFGYTTSYKLIVYPCFAGTIIGGILYALLTLLEFDRGRKYETKALTNSIVSPLVLNLVKVIGLMIPTIISTIIASLIYLPHTINKMGHLFDAYTYINCFYLYMLPSLIFSIIVSSAFYQLFNRIDISMIAYILLAAVTCSKKLHGNNIVHWIYPTIPTLSDYFGNLIVFRLMNYNRFFWSLIFIGLWLTTLLCVRSYGKGLLGSFLNNLKKGYIPLLAIVFIGSGCYAYLNQPYVYYDNNSSDEVIRNKYVKLLGTDLEGTMDATNSSLSAKVIYSLENKSATTQDTMIKVNPGYIVNKILANGNELTFKSNSSKDLISFTLPKDESIKLNVEYYGSPKMSNKESDFSMSTMITDKYINLVGLGLFPSIVLEKENKNPIVMGKFTMPSNLTPVCDGGNAKLISENGSNRTWSVDNSSGSFFSFSLVAGDYSVKKFKDEDMPIEFYYSNKSKTAIEESNAEELMEFTANYCKSHYGKLHDVTQNNPLKIVQGTSYNLAGFGLANLSIMPEETLSDHRLKDKHEGASAAEVLAHETVHQWWNFRYIKDDNNPDWSAEGLTVYTCYRVMKEKYGEAYAKENFIDFWTESLKENNKNFYNRHPEYLKILSEDYARSIEFHNTTTATYVKMPLQILKATELVGGETNMDKILSNLFNDIPKKQAISWQDFLDACNLKEEDLKID